MHIQRQRLVGDVAVSRSFGCDPRWVRAARDWASEEYCRVGGRAADACQLLVSEVVTNAVRHTSSATFTVRVYSSHWIEVQDSSSQLPQARSAGPESESGRGLSLLDVLAPGHRVKFTETGKCIQFRPRSMEGY